MKEGRMMRLCVVCCLFGVSPMVGNLGGNFEMLGREF